MHTSKTKKSNLLKPCATFSVALLLAVIYATALLPISNTTAIECVDGITPSGGICSTDTTDVHVSVEGGWAISVSSAGTLGLEINPTSSGTFSAVTDNLNIYTNIPTGYQLYLNSTSGSTDIYNNSLLDDNGNLPANLPADTNTNHFSATTGTKDSPTVLTSGTWGYSLDNSPTTFSKVPLTSNDADSNIYTNPTKTSSSGDDIPVTYGFMADTKLSPGTYSTSVAYTAIADAPAYTITSISPSTLQQDDQTNKTITIMTSTPATELAFGEVSAKIDTVDLTDCIEITQDVSGTSYRGVTCTYSGSLTPGYYTIELTSSWHNATYTLADGFNIKRVEFSSCSEMSVDDVGILKDYEVVKLADGKCWQTTTLRTATWANRGSCPTGFTFPSKSDFDTLVSKYSGGGLYSAWGLSALTTFWSSTEYSSSVAYYLRVIGSNARVSYGDKTNSYSVRCYTTQ